MYIDLLQEHLGLMEKRNPSRNNYPPSGREGEYFARGRTQKVPESIRQLIEIDPDIQRGYIPAMRGLARTITFFNEEASFNWSLIKEYIRKAQWCYPLFKSTYEALGLSQEKITQLEEYYRRTNGITSSNT
jgi:hypothetical protein